MHKVRQRWSVQPTSRGLQRGLPGRRRAWQVQVALNRCYYMLNRRRRFTSATPSVLGDAICAPPAVSAVPDQLNARLDEEGERRTALLFCDCTRVSSASSAEGVSFHPYQLSPLVSGVFATNSGIAPHAALPHPLPPSKHVHHVWVWNGLWNHSVCPILPRDTSPKASQSRLWGVW